MNKFSMVYLLSQDDCSVYRNKKQRDITMNKTKLLKNQNGAVAVAFSIILLLFLTLVFGIIEFGLLLFNKQVITNAGREGTRYGIVVRIPRRSDDKVVEEVKNYSESHLVTFGDGTLDIHLERKDADGNFLGNDADGNPILGQWGDYLTVTVTYPYDFLFLSGLGIGPVNITAISRMGME